MENNELMNVEEIMDDVVVTKGKPSIGTGGAMLIGAGLTLAVGAGIKLVKKGIAAYRAKKALKESENEDLVEIDDEDVE